MEATYTKDLNDCPFCGSQAAEIYTEHRRGTEEEWTFHWVECCGCDARGPEQATAPGAAAAWNKRVQTC